MSRVGFGVGWIWVGGGVGNGRPLQVRARSPEKVCPQMTQICADGPEPRPATPSSHRHAGGCRHPRLLAFRTIGLVAPNLDRDAAGPLPRDSRCARDAISYRPMTVRCTVDIRTVLEPEANMSSRGQKLSFPTTIRRSRRRSSGDCRSGPSSEPFRPPRSRRSSTRRCRRACRGLCRRRSTVAPIMGAC